MSETRKELKRSKKEILQEEEKLLLIAEADSVKGEQLFIDLKGEIVTENELNKFAFGDTPDPELMYDVYYNGIQKLLIKHLPEGKAYKEARDYIFEEKNTFLTRGHRKQKDGKRGADSRMGYKEDAKQIMNIVIPWIIRKGTMVDLYTILRDLNISKGYGKPIHE